MPLQKVTKTEIIEIARQVFTKQGYHHTSMNDIAEASGLRKGSLYHHFKGKEELMIAAIDCFHQQFKTGAFSALDNKDFNTQQKLNHLIDYSEKTYLADEGSMMANIMLEVINTAPTIAECIKKYFEEWIASVTQILSEVYPAKGAQKIAKESIAAIEGAVMMMQIFNDKSFLTRVHEGLRRRVVQDILEREMV